MKITENSKIRILSPEHSEYVQKIAFESGLGWNIGGKVVYRQDAGFLFFYPNDESHRITASDSWDTFLDHENKEIFIPVPTPEWNGEGCPPVGTVCELNILRYSNFKKDCRIEAYSIDKSMVFVSYQQGSDREYEGWHIDDDLRFCQIETEAQKARRKRDKLADEICGRIVLHYGNPKMAEAYIGVSKHLADWLIEANKLKEDE